ncbi:MAG: hypothetical protein V4500_10870 [Pseudomonadota bacterium]
MLEELENRTWVERNAEALVAHGMTSPLPGWLALRQAQLTAKK